MIGLKGLVAGISSWIVLVLAAVFIIQLQCGRIDKLQRDKANLEADARADSLYAMALKDSLRSIGEYKPVPESIPVPIPYPIVIAPKPVLTPPDSGAAAQAYLVFYTKDQWEDWYRTSCAGVIEGRDSTIWENGVGASVYYKFFYGLATNELNRLLILPAGNWRPPPRPKEGFRGGLTWQISNKGDLSVGADITWRKWGPVARIDFLHDDKPTYWGGIRRNF